MTKHGCDTVVAKDLLRLLEETLTIWSSPGGEPKAGGLFLAGRPGG